MTYLTIYKGFSFKANFCWRY